jgi:hypothetical protein
MDALSLVVGTPADQSAPVSQFPLAALSQTVVCPLHGDISRMPAAHTAEPIVMPFNRARKGSVAPRLLTDFER